MTIDLSELTPQSLASAQAIAQRAGVNPRDCYQCGKCSAGCPMAESMDAPPQKIMRMIQMGLGDKALEARSPWLCLQCGVCTERCPQSIDVTAVMLETRRASHAAGKRAVPESDTFETLFINGVRSHGRSNEQYLAAKYNLASGHLFQDVASAPAMLAKGMIGVAPHSSKDPAAIRRLIERCEESARGGASREEAGERPEEGE